MSLWCTRTGFGIIMLNSMNTAVFSPALVTRRRDRPSGASVSMAIPIANCTLQSNTSLRIRMWYNRHREGFLHLQDKLQLHVDILVQRPTDISLHHRCRGALSGLWMMSVGPLAPSCFGIVPRFEDGTIAELVVQACSLTVV